MAGVKNKFLTWLAISNVFAFIIIFILFWMLWENFSMFQQKNITVQYMPEQALTRPPAREIPDPQPVEPSVNEEDLSIITAVAREVKSNKIDSSLSSDPVSNETSKTATKKDDSATLSDEEYIALYEKIKNKQKTVKPEISEKEATSVTATPKKSDTEIPAQNRFNKVDLSKRIKASDKKLSLAEQVAQIAVIADEKQINNSASTGENRTYLASLKEAEAERLNEMRTITVYPGDTLWKIATRAYGTGFLYKKIFKANPHLTNPNDITVGEVLRVPL